MAKKYKSILFEPWSLGDAIIAAAIARESPDRLILACNPKWHELIRAGFNEGKDPKLIGVTSSYTEKARSSKFDSSIASLEMNPDHDLEEIHDVLSIRGDIRDYKLAKNLFPGKKLKFTGWYKFLARRSALLDLPQKMGLLKVENRYQAWAKLCGMDFRLLRAAYNGSKTNPKKYDEIMIHVGAQWKSKQYPFVKELMTMLKKENINTKIVRGPGDALPPSILEDESELLIGSQLINKMKNADLIITNDSGPMHLAAFLNRPYIAIGLATNTAEWLPPGGEAINSDQTPLGYKPHSQYSSDNLLEGWPGPLEVFNKTITKLGLKR